MRIAIGSDHGGFELKNHLTNLLKEKNIDVIDHGCNSTDAVDYPDHAAGVAKDVSTRIADQGIIICTSGIGVSITANKFQGVRAALCVNSSSVKTARAHNNANILCLGSLHTSLSDLDEILTLWLSTDFDKSRHSKRVDLSLIHI